MYELYNIQHYDLAGDYILYDPDTKCCTAFNTLDDINTAFDFMLYFKACYFNPDEADYKGNYPIFVAYIDPDNCPEWLI